MTSHYQSPLVGWLHDPWTHGFGCTLDPAIAASAACHSRQRRQLRRLVRHTSLQCALRQRDGLRGPSATSAEDTGHVYTARWLMLVSCWLVAG